MRGTSKAKLIAAFAVAAVLGAASIAAAAPGDPGSGEAVVEPAPEDVTPGDGTVDDTPEDAVDEEPVADEVDEDTAADSPATTDEDDPADCLTHGQRVSAVARTTPAGPGHGRVVSEAARDHGGECGDDPEAPEEPTVPVPEPEPTVNAAVESSGSGHGASPGGPPAHVSRPGPSRGRGPR
jgi:hypothetical protein